LVQQQESLADANVSAIYTSLKSTVVGYKYGSIYIPVAVVASQIGKITRNLRKF